jgi:hypothetical protein
MLSPVLIVAYYVVDCGIGRGRLERTISVLSRKMAIRRDKDWRWDFEEPISAVSSITRRDESAVATWQPFAQHLFRTSDKERLGN